jgi:2-dehydro-3-deoxyglucarate aldolase/4-hydroxy-2-oxoheptanedioate aldolase
VNDSFKQRLIAKERLNVFAVGRMFNPNVIHYLGATDGFDGMWIDVEHTGFSTREIESAVSAAAAHGLESFARIPPTDYATVTQCLESGVAGVMAAQIGSAAQAEEFVTWAKFHPRGSRGLNPLGRDGGFGAMPLAEFTARANEENFVAIQIETVGAVAEVDEIAAIDGVDLLFVGPSDLSQALGVTGDLTHPRCLDAIDSVARACETNGKPWGAVTPNPEYARHLIDRGCTLISAVNDVKLVTNGMETMRRTFAEIW